MKDFFKEAFEYHFHFNEVYLKIFVQETDKVPPASYALFCHVLNAHQIWCARILSLPPVGVRDEHSTAQCFAMNIENHGLALQVLKEKQLEDLVQYTNTKGQAFSNSVRDILFHVVNHNTHHKGQIAMQLRMAGIQPPVTDYIFYKR